METQTAVVLLLNQPTTPAALAIFGVFIVFIAARVYTLHLALRDSEPKERPEIMREHRNMWALRQERSRVTRS